MGNVFIDPFSGAAVALQMRRGTLDLATGTGFLWQTESGLLMLVTCWHCVTGTDPKSGQSLSSNGARPTSLRISTPDKNNLGAIAWAEVALYGPDERPVWRVHPLVREKVDVVCLPIPPLPPNLLAMPINTIPQGSIAARIASDVFIIGFPLGISRLGVPIWKRASIASEPNLTMDHDDMRFMLVDTATREGLSGAPVILRSSGGYYDEQDRFVLSSGLITKFLGIYSGRLATTDPMGAQLGIVWPAGLVEDVIRNGVLDDFHP